MRNTRAKTRNTVLVNPAGVAFPGGGVELKDRESFREKEDKKQMSGFFVTGVGFLSDLRHAQAVQGTQQALARYIARVAPLFTF